MLGLLRGVADEVVVAADERAHEEDVAAYGAVADVVHRFPHEGTESHLAWAHALCSGDWILRLDGDEVPSAALLAALPELTQAQTAQIWLPRRWLFGEGTWIAQVPWWPDFHNRLVRHDERLRFEGRLHTAAEPVEPARWITDPFYHLDLVLNSMAVRRVKAHRYAEVAPERLAPGGGELNHAYYLPERRTALRLEAVPAEDRALIDRVLGAKYQPRTDRTASLRMATAEDVAAAASPSPLDEHDYRAAVIPFGWDPRFLASEHRTLHAQVSNWGGAIWPGGMERAPRVRLGSRWLCADGAVLGEGPRAALPGLVTPGRSVLVPIPVVAPSVPGRYQLEIDLVHEDVRWFEAGRPLEVAVVGGESQWSLAAQELAPSPPGKPVGGGRPRLGRVVCGLRRNARLGYLGPVGHGSLGDEAIWGVAAASLPGLRPISPRADERFNLDDSLDGVVLGGSTLIGHAKFRHPLEDFIVRQPQARLHALSPGVGDPDYRGDDQAAIAAEIARWSSILTHMEPVAVRGPRSRALLAQHGIRSEIVGHPALLLAEGQPSPDDPERLLGINAGITWRMRGRDPALLLDQLAVAGRAARHTGWGLRLVSVWPPDVPYLHELAGLLGGDVQVHDCRTVEQALASIRPCRVFVGMKLHAIVFASALLVPAVALEYQPKVRDFQASLSREELALPTDELIVEELSALVERLSVERAAERGHLAGEVAARRAAIRSHLATISSGG